MKGPKPLFKFEDHWPTEIGKWFPEERVVFRGQDLFSELNETPWMELFLYGITGKRFSTNQIQLFEGIWVIVTSFPDPCIWPNRVAALAGTTRSTGMLAMSSATAAFEAEILGGRATLRSADFLVRTQAALDQGGDLTHLIKAELKKYRSVPGYGRPIASSDERIEPLFNLSQKLNLSNGKYTKLAFEIKDCLAQLFPLQRTINMTIASLLTSLSLDQDLTPREIYNYMSICASTGMMTCFIDATNKPEGMLFPLRCSRIKYTGKPTRKWDQ